MMPDPKGDKLFVRVGASEARRRLKGFRHGVRKIQSAGRNRAAIIHTARGQHLQELEARFADVGFAHSEAGLAEPHHEERKIMTLYERLGGVFAIATVVDDFIDRVMNDPRLNANPRVNEAHHKVAPAGFKYLVTEQVCQASGGPQRYTGRSMRDSHVDLAITEAEWQAFLDDFKHSFDKFNVPAAEQAELFAIVDSTKKDIVVPDTRRALAK
jgi:hemoglobin